MSNPSTSSAPTVNVLQPIPVRTLVAICVAAFVLVVGLVLFVLWFGARSRKQKGPVQDDITLNISKTTTSDGGDPFKGIPPSNPRLGVSNGGYSSEQLSYYSQQSIAKKPILSPQHARQLTQDSLDQNRLDLNHYRDEASFFPKEKVYTRTDMAPLSPRSAAQFSSLDPIPLASAPQSPHLTSAQAIIRPYVIGSHPYASPGRGTPSSRPSIEHVGGSTVAIAYPEQDRQGLELSGSNAFAGAGQRPGYNSYGIESRQPITSLNARPSLESIKNLARKASVDQTAVNTATEFAMGGPTAVGSRSRNNSTSSSHYRGFSGYERSLYGGGGGSIKSTKSGKDVGKERLGKAEKQGQMKAMGDLIAALDANAEQERKRRDLLAAAAGIQDLPPSENNVRSRDAVTGAYPLPPANVFRAALGGQSPKVQDDNWVDDEEIERWRIR